MDVINLTMPNVSLCFLIVSRNIKKKNGCNLYILSNFMNGPFNDEFLTPPLILDVYIGNTMWYNGIN